jgi:hypothetical protein
VRIRSQMTEKTNGNQVNRGTRLRRHLRIPRNMMIRARQQRSGGIAVGEFPSDL